MAMVTSGNKNGIFMVWVSSALQAKKKFFSLDKSRPPLYIYSP
jgi:hypothetical protein